MISQNSNVANSDLAQRGIKLCADIVPSSDQLETLMFKERKYLDRGEVCDAVAGVEAPYTELLKYYNDVVKIMRTGTHDKKNMPKMIRAV